MSDMKDTFRRTLVSLLETKPLGEITVKEVARLSGVSRQIFYYHFTNIWDLVNWIFIQESEKALREHSDIGSWKTGYIRLMRWAVENKALVSNVCASVERERVETFMRGILHRHIEAVVEEEARGLRVTREQRAFIARFYTLALVSFSLDWMKDGMRESPEEVAAKVGLMIEGDFRKALLRFQEANLG